MTKYAITAATGRFGRAAVAHLLMFVDPKNIVLVVRDAQKAKQYFDDVEIREASYDNETAMTQALEGVDRVLFISSQPGGQVPRLVQHQNVIKALVANHIAFVAYTSFPHADQSQSFLVKDHRETEAAIVSAGLTHAFLRNNWYLENETSFLKAGATGRIAYYWANQSVGWALEREYAEAAANILANGFEKEIYEFAGSTVTFDDLGVALKQTVNPDAVIRQVSRSDYTAQLETNGLTHDSALMITSLQEPIADGSLAQNSLDLVNVLGHDLVALPEAIKEVLS